MELLTNYKILKVVPKLIVNTEILHHINEVEEFELTKNYINKGLLYTLQIKTADYFCQLTG